MADRVVCLFQLDNRIRFIAESVFNLITVTWNRDSRDWAIPSLFSQTVPLSIEQVTSYVNGSKSPGMNILEHELNDACVSVFEGVYPAYVSNGWDIRNLPQALSKGKGKGYVAGDAAREVSRGVSTDVFHTENTRLKGRGHEVKRGARTANDMKAYVEKKGILPMKLNALYMGRP